MRLVDRRAARHRGLVCVVAVVAVVAVVLALCPALTAVRAQDAAPAAGPAAIGSAGEAVLLRDRPGYDAAVMATLADGGAVEVQGAPVTATDGSSWLPVAAAGQSGYVPAGYVAPPLAAQMAPAASAPAESAPAEPIPVIAADPAASAPTAGATLTTTDANLRAGPSADAQIMMVLPPGTTVSIDGAASNGFVPVTGNGVAGWVAVELLTGEPAPGSGAPGANPGTLAAPAVVEPAAETPADLPAPEPVTTAAPASPPEQAPATASEESTGITWPFTGGEWQVVQGYNNGTHTNRGGVAQYKYSLDWARVEGDSAGQPVFAPISGTIEWIDRGSGGMLVNAGNGYGVAVFHVTYDRGVTRGGNVERGQQIGTISGPGGDGYESMAHIDITCWRLSGGGNEAVPFTGPNAIAGREFPDTGGTNQHMGETVTP